MGENRSKKSAVISGIGPVCAIGTGREEFAAALAAGESGIDEISRFDVSGLPSSLGAEVIDLNMEDYLRSRKNYLDRNSELAFAACELAIRDAGVDIDAIDRQRVGLCMGTQWGNMATLSAFVGALREKGPRFAPPFIFPHAYPNTTSSLLSIEYGIQGYNENFADGAVSGAHGVAAAVRAIRSGWADCVLTGGVDGMVYEIYAGAALTGHLSPGKGNGEEGCRPFSPDGNGAVIGEAGAFLVVESDESCSARGGKVLAEISGEGLAGSIVESIEIALKNAGAKANEIIGIFASANGSPDIDQAEAGALRGIFADLMPPLFALKGLAGECMGAFGPLNIIAAVCSMGERAKSSGDVEILPLLSAPGWSPDDGKALVVCCDSDGQAASFIIAGR